MLTTIEAVAMETPIAFDRQSAVRLSRNLRKSETFLNNTKPTASTSLITNQGSVIIKTPSLGIPARAGTVLGKAFCETQVLNRTTDDISNGVALQVFNLSETLIAGDTYVAAIRDKNGVFFVSPSVGNGGGIVRATAEVAFTSSTSTVDCSVVLSYVDGVANGESITANNYLQMSGDLGGPVYVYYHADDDGTFDLINAKCPA